MKLHIMYHFFPYSTQGVYNTNLEGQIGTATPQLILYGQLKLTKLIQTPKHHVHMQMMLLV